jgi:hypothetical protein
LVTHLRHEGESGVSGDLVPPCPCLLELLTLSLQRIQGVTFRFF